MQEQILVLADGRKFSIAEYGNPHGVPVLFFHGTPGSRIHPATVYVDEMQDAPIRMIAMERPGYGLSDPQADRTLLGWPQDVYEVTEQLGIREFSILAIAGGAPYALATASKLPTRVQKIAILAGLGPLQEPSLVDGFPKQQYAMMLAAQHAPEDVAATVHQLHHNPGALATGVADHLQAADKMHITPERIQTYVQTIAEATRQSEGMLSDYRILLSPWHVDFRTIQAPVHLWHGDMDSNVPMSHSQYLAGVLNHAHLTILPGLGHFGTSIAAMEEVLTFLR